MFFPLILLTTMAIVAPDGGASAGQQSAVGSEAEGLELARRHAPVLVFHPDEDFFPTSPIYPLEAASRGDAAEAAEEFGDGELSRADALRLLGTAEQRREAYRALSQREKSRLATVYYRVDERDDAVIVEYWLYYVWNEYRARPDMFPFSFDSSHANDLEHIHVVLRRHDPGAAGAAVGAAGGLRLESIRVSAHEGIAPANRYRPGDGARDARLEVLVERGSHAGGTDVDRDGRFTPGDDGESGHKILWGVRDHGRSWSWYDGDGMDRRGDDAPRWCAAGSTSGCPDDASRYRLVPVDHLYRRFERLGLSAHEIEQAFETDVGAFKRLLGKSNGQADKLLMPPKLRPDRPTVPEDAFSSTENGFMLGVSTMTSSPGFFVGARYSFLHGAKWFPDVLLQADPIVTIEGEPFFSSALLLSYPLGAVTKVVGGAGYVTDFDAHQWDWIGGFEFKIGGVRVSFTGRTLGDVTHSAMDLRLYYFFE